MDPIGIIEELVQNFKSNFDTIIFLVASATARGVSSLKYIDPLLLRLFRPAFITPLESCYESTVSTRLDLRLFCIPTIDTAPATYLDGNGAASVLAGYRAPTSTPTAPARSAIPSTRKQGCLSPRLLSAVRKRRLLDPEAFNQRRSYHSLPIAENTSTKLSQVFVVLLISSRRRLESTMGSAVGIQLLRSP